MRTVLIFGSFDILHPGHLYLIRKTQELGEVHAGLALDETIMKIKGRAPYYPLAQRMEQLRRFDVIPHAGDATDRMKVLREVNPDLVNLGYDQHIFVDILEQYIQVVKPSLKVMRAHLFRRDLFSSSRIRKVFDDPNAGFLCIDKPLGEPSFATVTALRKQTALRQVGFAGTLDPLASGLLICGIGNATTMLDYFHFFPKTYEADIILGATSDTYDAEGALMQQSDMKPSAEDVVAALHSFAGIQEQTVPLYSAKKIQGVKLYEHARRGERIEAPKHTIAIHRITMDEYAYPRVRCTVTCSSGTYIRALAHDIGKRLGVGGYLGALRRTAIGPYTSSMAWTIAEQGQLWRERLIDPRGVMEKVNAYFWETPGAFDERHTS